MNSFTEEPPDDGERPDESTEEFLLGGIDEEIRPEQPGGSEKSEQPENPERPGQGESPGPYVEQPTEEVFAIEAHLAEGEDVPELDPILRAALLEGSESEVSSAATGQEPASGEAGTAEPATGEGEASGETETGESEAGEPDTGESEAGEPDPGTADRELPSEAEITAAHTAELAALAKTEVHDAIAVSRKTGEPWSPSRPPTAGDFQEPARRRHFWWRFMLATVIIVFSFAGATSASIIHFVDGIASDISTPKLSLSDKLLPKTNGGPQTIAILGSDVRTGGGDVPGDPGRSDTTMLLRLDPSTNQIAVMSIPRDLKVDIPGHGVDKFNAAYTYGGPALTLKTIKSVTGLDVNHVINIDFQGFADVIDAIGCVYIDVDRKYYHSNAGLPPAEQYAEIDIDAGYQKLCGSDALDYARYRHTDSDLSRAARQQGLLRQVRSRLSFGEVLRRNKELIKAFTKNTKSDIGDQTQIFAILKLLFESKNAQLTQVEFPATLPPLDASGVSYVTATPDQIKGAVDKFLGFKETPGPLGSQHKGEKKSKAAKKQEKKVRKRAAKKDTVPSGDGGDLADASQTGLDVSIGLQKEIKRGDFPVYYPKLLPPGTIYTEGSRVYHVRDPDKSSHGAYRMVMALQLDDGLHYFGLQGIRGWEDPPILDAPHDDVSRGGRDFRVYPEGDRISMVSWTDRGNLYWVSNSILQTLSNDQMMGIAESTKAFTPGKQGEG